MLFFAFHATWMEWVIRRCLGLSPQLSTLGLDVPSIFGIEKVETTMGPYLTMSVRKEFVRVLAAKVAEELVQQEMIEIPEGFDLIEPLYEVMAEEASLEDRLNEEVRLMLNQYQEQMKQSGASYQEMFKLIKNKLVKERKLVL